MDLISSYAPLFLEAQAECDSHRREMCQIVISGNSDQEIANKLRDSILRYRARAPKKGPEPKDLPTDKTRILQFFTFIKTQSDLFEKHDLLVDAIAANLKSEIPSLDTIRRLLI